MHQIPYPPQIPAIDHGVAFPPGVPHISRAEPIHTPRFEAWGFAPGGGTDPTARLSVQTSERAARPTIDPLASS